MVGLRPIIVVTGANSGVGFGICHRLLLQLSHSTPPDALPQFIPLDSKKSPHASAVECEPCDGLTLILACRNPQRALRARQQLLCALDDHILKERRRPGYDGHAELFRRNLDVQFHIIDMASIHSVFQFGNELLNKYPYVSHLICNAGGAVFEGLDWFGALKQIVRHPIIGTSVTEYKLQRPGIIGSDGLGLVWQSNVFSHYVLSRYLQPLFESYRMKRNEPARVLWMSSLEASPAAFSRDDWQCIETSRAYEATKYQIDLISHELYVRSLCIVDGSPTRHITVHPGISHSDLTKALISSVLEYLKLAFFYVVRFCGSRNHTIDATTAAISAVHLSLVSLFFIPAKLSTFTHTRFTGKSTQPPSLFEDSMYTHKLYPTGVRSAQDCLAEEARGTPSPIKFSSEVDRLGRGRVGVYTVIDFQEHKEDGEFIVDKCETLYQTWLKLEAEGDAR